MSQIKTIIRDADVGTLTHIVVARELYKLIKRDVKRQLSPKEKTRNGMIIQHLVCVPCIHILN